MKDASTKIKNTNLEDLYAAYGKMNLIEFREFVRDLIKNARAPNPAILRKIDTMSKDQLVFTATNFAFKGQGMGVK
jgi:hypothetical protein